VTGFGLLGHGSAEDTNVVGDALEERVVQLLLQGNLSFDAMFTGG
jgi:hypothetical protein